MCAVKLTNERATYVCSTILQALSACAYMHINETGNERYICMFYDMQNPRRCNYSDKHLKYFLQ